MVLSTGQARKVNEVQWWGLVNWKHSQGQHYGQQSPWLEFRDRLASVGILAGAVCREGLRVIRSPGNPG